MLMEGACHVIRLHGAGIQLPLTILRVARRQRRRAGGSQRGGRAFSSCRTLARLAGGLLPSSVANLMFLTDFRDLRKDLGGRFIRWRACDFQHRLSPDVQFRGDCGAVCPPRTPK
jgi:hypothetical protein